MNPIYVFFNRRTCRVPPARSFFLTLERAESLLHVKRQRMLERAESLLHVQAAGNALTCRMAPVRRSSKQHLKPPCKVPQKFPRTLPGWPFRRDFGTVWAICCIFCCGGKFQPPGQVPQNPSILAFSTEFHMFQNTMQSQ